MIVFLTSHLPFGIFPRKKGILLPDWKELKRGGNETMERLKVGVIGTGMGFERLHYPAYQELSDCYQIAAVCDQDRFKAEEWGSRLGLGAQDVWSQELRNLGQRR